MKQEPVSTTRVSSERLESRRVLKEMKSSGSHVSERSGIFAHPLIL